MKCNDAEKLILLQDSGELSGKRIAALDIHLGACESCRGFVQFLAESAKGVDIGEEPPVKIVQNVLRAARTSAPEKKHVSIFGLKPALSMAACLVILAGLLVGHFNRNRVGLELFMTDAQLLEPEDQVVSVMYEGLSEDDLAFNFLMTYDDSGFGG